MKAKGNTVFFSFFLSFFFIHSEENACHLSECAETSLYICKKGTNFTAVKLEECRSTEYFFGLEDHVLIIKLNLSILLLNFSIRNVSVQSVRCWASTDLDLPPVQMNCTSSDRTRFFCPLSSNKALAETKSLLLVCEYYDPQLNVTLILNTKNYTHIGNPTNLRLYFKPVIILSGIPKLVAKLEIPIGLQNEYKAVDAQAKLEVCPNSDECIQCPEGECTVENNPDFDLGWKPQSFKISIQTHDQNQEILFPMEESKYFYPDKLPVCFAVYSSDFSF